MSTVSARAAVAPRRTLLDRTTTIVLVSQRSQRSDQWLNVTEMSAVSGRHRAEEPPHVGEARVGRLVHPMRRPHPLVGVTFGLGGAPPAAADLDRVAVAEHDLRTVVSRSVGDRLRGRVPLRAVAGPHDEDRLPTILLW
jgi:hypothetical protein